MSHLHPKTSPPQAGYFYLPSINGKSAEIIQVLNCTTPSIRIPVPEEDIELFSFFQRDMSDYEIAKFGNGSAWRIFNYWDQFETDHLKHDVYPDIITLLLTYRTSKPLYEQHGAVA